MWAYTELYDMLFQQEGSRDCHLIQSPCPLETVGFSLYCWVNSRLLTSPAVSHRWPPPLPPPPTLACLKSLIDVSRRLQSERWEKWFESILSVLSVHLGEFLITCLVCFGKKQFKCPLRPPSFSLSFRVFVSAGENEKRSAFVLLVIWKYLLFSLTWKNC